MIAHEVLAADMYGRATAMPSASTASGMEMVAQARARKAAGCPRKSALQRRACKNAAADDREAYFRALDSKALMLQKCGWTWG
jgi:hypothetical protein